MNKVRKMEKNNEFIGNISQIKDIITIYKIDEVIFCSKDIAHREIIDKMSELHIAQVRYPMLKSAYFQ